MSALCVCVEEEEEGRELSTEVPGEEKEEESMAASRDLLSWMHARAPRHQR